MYNENKWPFTANVKSEYGSGIETDLNGIASEGVNRPQIEGLIAVGETSAFRSDRGLFCFLTVSC
jgi:hypothetical protein